MAWHGRWRPARPHVLLCRAGDGLSRRRARSGRSRVRRAPSPTATCAPPTTTKPSLTELARLCAAVSTEFENVPAASLDFLANTTFVSPAGRCVADGAGSRGREALYRDVGRAGGAACGDRIVGCARRARRRQDRRRAARHSEDRAARLRRQRSDQRAQRRGSARGACVARRRAVRAGKAPAAEVRSVGADRARRRTARRWCIRSRRTRTATACCRTPSCPRRMRARRSSRRRSRPRCRSPTSSAISACCASSSSFSKTARWSPTKWRRVRTIPATTLSTRARPASSSSRCAR